MNNSSTFLFLCLFLIGLVPVIGQEDSKQFETVSLFKINFLLPGLSYEQKIGKLSTLNSDIYLDLLLLSNETSSGSFEYDLTPSFKSEYRTYYNFHKRLEKERATENNSGNYFAPVYIGRYSPTDFYGENRWVSQLAGVWGMQRYSPSGFSFDLSAGIVYTFNTDIYTYYSLLAPIVQLRLGYCLGKGHRY